MAHTSNNQAVSLIKEIRTKITRKLGSLLTTSSKPNELGEATDEATSVSLNFIQTVIKKLPDLADGNPIKIAFSVARIIIDTKDAFRDNKNHMDECLLDAAERLQVVQAATDNGNSIPTGAEHAMANFTTAIEATFRDLEILKNTPRTMQVLDYEDRARKIQTIFRRIRTATEQFQIAMSIGIQITADGMQQELKIQALDSLKPSVNAQYNAQIFGKSLKREACTEGTRTEILRTIELWVDEPSPSCVFWLTGQAGSGKTTILYTIARTVDAKATATRLGGNFFCSRQFAETREPNRIIPTIVHQLAQICKPFGDALYTARISHIVPNPFSTVSLDVEAQLKSLLIVPWQRCEAKRAEENVQYLVVIDALDEMDEPGASEFLQHLFDGIGSHVLSGLKFLVASRTDPKIRKHIQSFQARKELWLQHVLADEASADIETYLRSHLSDLGQDNIRRIQLRANGLFIYAATVVRFVKPPGLDLAPTEQVSLLDKALSYSADQGKPASGLLIDTLYQQVMVDAFSQLPEDLIQHRLKILHFFLSTASRESPHTIAAIFGDNDDAIARRVVEGLHSVLYLQQDGRIFWYHASFPDFIFDSSRSRFRYPEHNVEYDFSCDQGVQRSVLLENCFDLLKRHLKFNYAGIKSSFLPDKDTYDIHKALMYAALNWAKYLPDTGNSDINTTLVHIDDFLDIRALFWIEAMNLMKKVGHCSLILWRTRQWLSECVRSDISHRVYEKLKEVIKFVEFFAHADQVELQRYTSHLYVSHLATWPMGPLTIQRWKKNFQGLPVLTHTEKADIQCLFTPSQLPQLSKFTPSQRTLDWIACVSFMSSDAQIVSGYEDGSLHLWDTTTGEFLAALEGHRGQVNSVATRGPLIISGSDDMYVHVWNGNLLQHTLLGHRIRGLVTSVDVSQSGTRIVSGSFDDTVRIWELVADRWEERLILRGHNNSVHSVAISSHGENVVSGSSDKSVRVWDIMSGYVICVLNGHTKGVNTVAFSPNNGQVISGSDDRTVRLWSVSAAQEQMCLRGHVGAVYSVAFMPDGQNVVSGSADTTVRVWNAETGEQVKVLCGHTGSVRSVAISRNAAQIVSGSFDGSIRVWDIVDRRKIVLLKSSGSEAPQNTGPDGSIASDCLLAAGRCGQWTILENGWIVSLESKNDRLMWVKPGRKETQVTDPSNILVISAGGYGSVDFSESWSILGEGWASCYRPVQTTELHSNI